MRTTLVLLYVYVAAMTVAGSPLDDLGIDVHGFVDARAGFRTQEDPVEKDASLAEIRLQLDLEKFTDLATFRVRADFLYDDIPQEGDLDIEKGTGFIDLREANLLLAPLDFMDVKIGRQILTWGTGDLLFINDMFPKDWQAFFIGRDEEYLKAPSDAVFVSLFPDVLGIDSIDVAYMPLFDHDRFISGDRLSYWNPMLGARAGGDAVVDPVERDEWFTDDEISGRVTWNLGGYELALYGYSGFWKNPVGMDPVQGAAIFPALAVYGGSVRGTLGGGIFNIEAGYYDSMDDEGGDDPLIPNCEIRALAGYEREAAKNLTVAVQYYIELMQDYSDYEASLPDGQPAGDEDRHVVTLRVTKLMMNQNLVLSLFVYYSPSDEDAYLRPAATYKITDNWMASVGGNVFTGKEEHTFFGQFEKNSNVYGAVRYSF